MGAWSDSNNTPEEAAAQNAWFAAQEARSKTPPCWKLCEHMELMRHNMKALQERLEDTERFLEQARLRIANHPREMKANMQRILNARGRKVKKPSVRSALSRLDSVKS
jgi:hypothetical protein